MLPRLGLEEIPAPARDMREKIATTLVVSPNAGPTLGLVTAESRPLKYLRSSDSCAGNHGQPMIRTYPVQTLLRVELEDVSTW